MTRGNLRVWGGSNVLRLLMDKLQIIERTIIGRNGVVCCLRMTALCPVIVSQISATSPTDRGLVDPVSCRLGMRNNSVRTTMQWRFLQLRRPHGRGGAETLKEPLITWDHCQVFDARSHDDLCATESPMSFPCCFDIGMCSILRSFATASSRWLETCKYKNVDFLHFLRSGSKDIDDFEISQQKRRMRGAH